MVGRSVGAEEVDAGAERQDEVVVVQRRHLGEVHLPGGEVHAGHRVLVDRDVRLLVEEVPQRMPDDLGREQIRGELVEEGLERVIVVLVHEHDVGVGVLQRAGGPDSREATAEDDDAGTPMRVVGLGAGCHVSSRRPGLDTAYTVRLAPA